jgi:hypothetical protein
MLMDDTTGDNFKMKLLGRVPTTTMAHLSIALNVVHLVLTLTLPNAVLPTTSAAFPVPVQILFWIEFFLAGIVFAKPIDAWITARAYPPSDVESFSVASTSPRPRRSLPTASTWIWPVLTVLSFVLLVLVTFHLHPPKV